MKTKLFLATAMTALLLSSYAGAAEVLEYCPPLSDANLNNNVPVSHGNMSYVVKPSGDTSSIPNIDTTTDNLPDRLTVSARGLSNTAIDRYDVNSDGVVSRAEWNGTMPQKGFFGMFRKPEATSFTTWDLNGDGLIDAREAGRIPR